MSRKVASVSVETASEILGRSVEVISSEGEAVNGMVELAYGYDRPLGFYFIDLYPECEIGIFYGRFGLTRKVQKGEFFDALKAMACDKAASAFALDLPF